MFPTTTSGHSSVVPTYAPIHNTTHVFNTSFQTTNNNTLSFKNTTISNTNFTLYNRTLFNTTNATNISTKSKTTLKPTHFIATVLPTTRKHTVFPTIPPTTSFPSVSPSTKPSLSPEAFPTEEPTRAPITEQPTRSTGVTSKPTVKKVHHPTCASSEFVYKMMLEFKVKSSSKDCRKFVEYDSREIENGCLRALKRVMGDGYEYVPGAKRFDSWWYGDRVERRVSMGVRRGGKLEMKIDLKVESNHKWEMELYLQKQFDTESGRHNFEGVFIREINDKLDKLWFEKSQGSEVCLRVGHVEVEIVKNGCGGKKKKEEKKKGLGSTVKPKEKAASMLWIVYSIMICILIVCCVYHIAKCCSKSGVGYGELSFEQSRSGRSDSGSTELGSLAPFKISRKKKKKKNKQTGMASEIEQTNLNQPTDTEEEFGQFM